MSSIQLTPPDEHADLQHRIATFVAHEVIPREPELREPSGVSWETIQELRRLARAAGIYGPHLPREVGGLGLDWRGVAVAFEEAGTSLLGPLALNAAAPDEGNMRLLDEVASDTQRERYFQPLASGGIRSCFAMTEPAPGAGADPMLLATRARRDGDGWVIDGHKWYITGADGAAFAIVMARTSDTMSPRRGATMFLVDMDAPGLRIVRHVGSLDQTFLGGHSELVFDGCRVDDDSVLGEVDLGFEYAQVRLVPARLTHCMRWLGIARRSLDFAATYAVARESGGRKLGEHQFVQAMLADSEIDIQAARLLIWQAAWALDQGRPARGESQIAKVFVAEAVNRVVDRAIQICGALGVSDDAPLGLFYREVRPFRIYDGPSEVHRSAIARRIQRRVTAVEREGLEMPDIDLDRLTTFLHTVPALKHETPVERAERIGRGQSNVTIRITLASGRTVILRRPPSGPLPPKAHDVMREARVIRALTGSAVPVPAIFSACNDEAVLGTPFYIMEDLPGDAIRAELPPPLADAPQADLRAIGEQVVDALAKLHALDPAEVQLGDLGRPTGYMARQLALWSQQLEYARTRPLSNLDWTRDWLSEHLPPETSRTCVVHGDYKLDNAIFSLQPPPRLLGVVDWEMATLGDPLADLGWLLAFWRDATDAPPELPILPRATELPGFPTRAELAARYASGSGYELPDLHYYIIFAQWKMAVLLEGHWARHVRGTAGDFSFAYLETAGPAFAARIRLTAEEAG